MSAEAEIRRRNIGEGDSLGESSLKPDDKGQKPAQESTTAESSDHVSWPTTQKGKKTLQDFSIPRKKRDKFIDFSCQYHPRPSFASQASSFGERHSASHTHSHSVWVHGAPARWTSLLTPLFNPPPECVFIHHRRDLFPAAVQNDFTLSLVRIRTRTSLSLHYKRSFFFWKVRICKICTIKLTSLLNTKVVLIFCQTN